MTITIALVLNASAKHPNKPGQCSTGNNDIILFARCAKQTTNKIRLSCRFILLLSFTFSTALEFSVQRLATQIYNAKSRASRAFVRAWLSLNNPLLYTQAQHVTPGVLRLYNHIAVA